MLSAISFQIHAVPHIPQPQLRQLVQEVNLHGPQVVRQNREGMAERLHQNGDEEFAQEARREAQYILDVYA